MSKNYVQKFLMICLKISNDLFKIFLQNVGQIPTNCLSAFSYISARKKLIERSYIMTLEEASIRLGKSETTLRDQFPRTKANLAKKGIILTRQGRGSQAEYFIEYSSEKLGAAAENN